MRGTVAPDEPAERTIPQGYHLEWRPDPAWRSVSGRVLCRRLGGLNPANHRVACQNEAIAEFQRGSRGWWAYCADHLYGRRIRNGVVEHRVLVEDEIGRLGDDGSVTEVEGDE